MQNDPHTLRQLVNLWITKIEKARSYKREVFQLDADTAQAFFDGPKDWDELMGVRSIISADDIPNPMFKMSVNKTFELVTVFGPNLYHDNPTRTVIPRRPIDIPPELFPDPMLLQSIQQQAALLDLENEFRAALLSQYLNLTPNDLDLRGNSRQAIDEALIKGRGCLWTELYRAPGGSFSMAGSFFDSVDNLLIDPDAEKIQDAKWIARRCCHPKWEVERMYGLKPDSLPGHYESESTESEINQDSDHLYLRRRGTTNDLVTYWKIWSRMGIGGRLGGGLNKALRGALEIFPDECFLVVCKDVPYPLNIGPGVLGQPAEAAIQSAAWPIPFWKLDRWPVAMLDFHPRSRCAWPLSHLKPAFGELKFLNWAMSFLAGKIRTTSRDFIAILKGAAEEMKEAILKGDDLTLLEITNENRDIREVVQFLQHPPMNRDVFLVIQSVEKMFEQRTGLNELALGGAPEKQIRSAEEVAARNAASNVRPDDMRKQVETWMSQVAENEAFAAATLLQAGDIAPILGDMGAQFWQGYITPTDINVNSRRFEIRIEAGSSRKPNKDQEVANMTESMQVMLPALQQYAGASGDYLPMNNLIAEWAKSRDMDPKPFALAPLPPPMPAESAEGGEPNGPPQPQ